MDSSNRRGDYERVKPFMFKDSENLGKTFYVCDFRHAVNQTRAFRDLKPTKVILISNLDYKVGFELLSPKNKNLSKRISFSENVFMEFEKGTQNINYKKHVPIFDNTGGSVYQSNALFVFESKREAELKYNELLELFLSDLEEKKQVVISELDTRIAFIKSKKV